MTDLKTLEWQKNRIGSAGTTDPMSAARISSDFGLQLDELWPSDEPLTFDHLQTPDPHSFMRALDVDQSGCYERNELVDRLCASG